MGDLVGAPALLVGGDELLVLRRLVDFEIRRRGEVASSGLAAHGGDLVFRSGQARHRHLGRIEAGGLVLPMQRHHGIADHRREDDVRLLLTELVDDRGELGMAERHVFLVDDFGAVFLEQLAAVIVLFLRVDVVRPDHRELLAEVLDQPRNEFILLLVRHRAGIDDVLRALAAFIQGRVPVKIVLLLHDGQHRLAAGGGVGAEHADAFVASDQLARLFGEGRGIGSRVFDHRHDLHAVDAARRVDFLNRQDGRLVQQFLDDRGSTCQRKQDTDLDLAVRRAGKIGVLDPDMRKARASKCTECRSTLQQCPSRSPHNTPPFGCPQLEASLFYFALGCAVSSQKKFKILPRPADLTRSVPILGRQNKKARQILADLSGLPSHAGPTTSVIRRKPRSELPRPTAVAKTKHLSRGTARAHLHE